MSTSALPKQYDPSEVEPRWLGFWLENGFFHADEAHRGVLDQRREVVRLGRQAAGSCFAQQGDGDGRETRGAANERRLRVAGASSPEPVFELDGGEIGVEVHV